MEDKQFPIFGENASTTNLGRQLTHHIKKAAPLTE
jgi:hypothetical protein